MGQTTEMSGMGDGLAIMAAVGKVEARTRIVKFVREYREAGIEPRFIGWRRTRAEGRTASDDPITTHRILAGGGYSGWRNRLMYPVFSVGVFIWILMRRPRAVHALSLETALPAVVARRLGACRFVIFDDADRLSMVIGDNIAGRILRMLERWVAPRVDLHVVPTLARYPDGALGGHVVVLPNLPRSTDVQAAGQCGPPVERRPGRRLVYVNGWLDEDRGASMILEAARRAAASDLPIDVVFAGRVTGAAATQLLRLPNVYDLGTIPQMHSLAQTRAADVVLTLYDPRREINRFAASNKWGDCLAMGTPFIANREVESSRVSLYSGVANFVQFGDSEALLALMLNPPRRSEPLSAEELRVSEFGVVVRGQVVEVLERVL